MRVRTWPVVGVVFAVLWVFVVGQPLTPISLLRGFLSGLIVGLPIAYVFRRLYGRRLDLGRGVRALPYAGLYLGAFTRELLWANVDVAYRVLSPGMPIEPEVILVPLRVESDVAVTVIANSITITPGTVSLDYDDETNALYVHGVNGRNPEAIAEPIRTWEDYALEIFAEDASPDDEPRPIVVSGGERDSTADRQRGGVGDD
ncbi:Na+/H+ antiporter subunit E [Natrinema thermotolerans]|uniref:Na+/H+ antiporter subunit E n=1 Tax=Natrinema thermotolerans TaxID=121872 RepID=A0AAF0P847_9EURY|nr:Na+/H+ antiporter subunit E [Natrinema thermotolerans]QCC60121.1 cation transporter [Natrinema thermotolerans]QCC61035.1 cation transporter [Natrinema thermotolerans]WMT07133.1 Na+/H+ antiporter subunit E [Natrinema thermotolerans]